MVTLGQVIYHTWLIHCSPLSSGQRQIFMAQSFSKEFYYLRELLLQLFTIDAMLVCYDFFWMLQISITIVARIVFQRRFNGSLLEYMPKKVERFGVRDLFNSSMTA